MLNPYTISSMTKLPSCFGISSMLRVITLLCKTAEHMFLMQLDLCELLVFAEQFVSSTVTVQVSFFKAFILLFWVGVGVMAHLWRSKDNFGGSALSFHHVGLRD